MLTHSVGGLVWWTETTPVDAYLIHTVRSYLLAQGTKGMMNCMNNHSGDFLALTEVQDRLSWDNFVEGQISKLFLSYVQQLYMACQVKGTAERWCQTL